MRLCPAIGFLVLLQILTVPGFAWDSQGHRMVARLAVSVLPKGGLKTYLSSDSAGQACIDGAPLPDQWKRNDSSEGPRHYVNLEYYQTAWGGWYLPASPDSTRAEAGVLPWALTQRFGELTSRLRSRSSDVATWCGVLSHYAADTNMPLHTTINYDGRVRPGTAPERVHKGVHRDYESGFLGYLTARGVEAEALKLARGDLATGKASLADLRSVSGEARQEALQSFYRVKLLYSVFDQTPACDAPRRYELWSPRLRPEMTRELAQSAIFTVRLWLTAWHQSGSALPPH